TEAVAVRSAEPAVAREPLDGVGIQYFAPDVRVVTRVVAAGEGVGEIGAGIAGGHGRIAEACGCQCLSLEGGDIGDAGTRFELMPGLVEQGGSQVLAGGETLVEPF